jgi:hypothetical protein
MALIFIGVCCHLGYLIVGSSIDTDGFLIEPFALIPIGYLFYLLGLIRIIPDLFCSHINNRSIFKY